MTVEVTRYSKGLYSVILASSVAIARTLRSDLVCFAFQAAGTVLTRLARFSLLAPRDLVNPPLLTPEDEKSVPRRTPPPADDVVRMLWVGFAALKLAGPRNHVSAPFIQLFEF